MQTIKRAPATEGAIFTKLILFTLPIMLTGILQLLYNSADSIIVGRFSGDPNALGAVGSTGTATGLLINMLMGLGAGTSVLVSQFYGAKNHDGVSRVVHTSMTAALIGGVFILGLGELLAKPLLLLLGTKAELLPGALLYVRIIFLGVPASALFNFGAAAIRSIGDSRTPLIILASTGLLNVGLNLVFVIGCGMSVDGVALATVISQYVSAATIIIILMRTKTSLKLSVRKLGINGVILRRMLRIAIPSAIQSSMFSISNMTITSSINTFSTDQVSGNAVASTIECFAYTSLNSYYVSTLTFVGQNYGAKKFSRTRRVLYCSLLQVTVVGLAVGAVILAFAEPLSLLFVDPSAPNAAAVIAASVEKLNIIMLSYVLCGYMETFTGFLRGWGYSLLPMISSVLCACVFRMFWASFIFPLEPFNNFLGLFMVYPISWILAILVQGTMSFFVSRRSKYESLV